MCRRFPLSRLVCGYAAVCSALLSTSRLPAQDWSTVPIINHSAYQAVDGNGASAYPPGTSGFPVRLVGVVTNSNQDWLNPAAAYATGPLMNLGGQAEYFVQAVNLDGTAYDPDPATPFADFGGTACWMGQNYGNHPFHFYQPSPSSWSYSNEQWTAELDRLGFSYQSASPAYSSTYRVQPGDLVEIRARIGLNYAGKMNVNENHSNVATNDWEIVVLKSGFGLPQPAPLALADLKDADNKFVFDASRASGGEHYQATLVELQDVTFTNGQPWGQNVDTTITDASGRTLTVHLGLNDSFANSAAPTGSFNVTGVLDQLDTSFTGGYRLLVMDAGSFAPVPEPPTLALLSIAAFAGLATLWRRRGGR